MGALTSENKSLSFQTIWTRSRCISVKSYSVFVLLFFYFI